MAFFRWNFDKDMNQKLSDIFVLFEWNVHYIYIKLKILCIL